MEFRRVPFRSRSHLATKPRQYRLASLPALDLRRRFLDKPQRVQLRRVALPLQALLAHTLREVSPARVGNPELDGPKPRRTHPLAVPRSAKRRVGKESVSPGRARGSPYK